MQLVSTIAYWAAISLVQLCAGTVPRSSTGNARPLTRLEERHGHHLRAHQREDTHDDSQGRNTLGHHIGIGGEKRSHLTGEQEDKQITYGHHRRGTSQGKLHNTPHTSIKTGSNIEAHNRLQALAYRG